jgi:hypothetical protein
MGVKCLKAMYYYPRTFKQWHVAVCSLVLSGIAVLILPVAAGATAQGADSTSDSLYPINLNIVRITLEGAYSESNEEILAHVKAKIGDRFDRGKLLQDLESINKMGCFDSYQLAVYPQLADGGVAITIRLADKVGHPSTVQTTYAAKVENFSFRQYYGSGQDRNARRNFSDDQQFHLFIVRDLWGRQVFPAETRAEFEKKYWACCLPVTKSRLPYKAANKQDLTNLRSQLDQFLNGSVNVLPGYDAL